MSWGPPLSLLCHPDTPTQTVRTVVAHLWRLAPDGLALLFVLDGDLGGVRIPELRAPRRRDGLWQHTCCEAFLRVAGSDAYHEINLAPSGEWAAYAFTRYREDMSALGVAAAPVITVRHDLNRLHLEARVPLRGLVPGYAVHPLRLALATVVEEIDGRLSYWALHHPPGRADFHHPDAFVARV